MVTILAKLNRDAHHQVMLDKILSATYDLLTIMHSAVKVTYDIRDALDGTVSDFYQRNEIIGYINHAKTSGNPGLIFPILPTVSERLNTTANTYLYRSYSKNGRIISLINHKVPNAARAMISDVMLAFKDFVNNLSKSNKFIKTNGVNTRTKRITNYGVMKHSGGYIQSARSHESCSVLAKVDISKFFDSMTLQKMLDKDLFLNAMKVNINYEYMCFRFKKYPDAMRQIDLALLNANSIFLSVVPFFLHNGRIPTGMQYSTHLSNYLFSSIDKKIENKLREASVEKKATIYHTRYIDDISIGCYQPCDIQLNHAIDINLIKDIESIVNESGFYLKYDKTKIYGSNDTKVVHGISFGGIKQQPPSVNSNLKYLLAKEIEELGKSKTPLNSSVLGKLHAIKCINHNQYAYCLSHYFMHRKFTHHSVNVGTYDYRCHIQAEILYQGSFYDLHVKPVLGGK